MASRILTLLSCGYAYDPDVTFGFKKRSKITKKQQGVNINRRKGKSYKCFGGEHFTETRKCEM